MKISDVERNGSKVTVYYIPNWFEKLIGIKPKYKNYFDTGRTMMVGGGISWRDEKGYKIGSNADIDAALFRKGLLD